ncbi:hypothetical protein EZV62_021787 [Acer yangbiense]|uniref:Uncharacterized protein n=1 Tax=Acer yangbiense TaxID=1000413 RepID=A0A5C7H6D9_9ROSI|nr:hypothetical protein EZV62_021787 [Acer yangbiense]
MEIPQPSKLNSPANLDVDLVTARKRGPTTLITLMHAIMNPREVSRIKDKLGKFHKMKQFEQLVGGLSRRELLEVSLIRRAATVEVVADVVGVVAVVAGAVEDLAVSPSVDVAIASLSSFLQSTG